MGGIQRLGWRLTVLVCLLLVVPAALRAQESDEFDQYKLRIGGFWFYSQPTGTIQGHADQYPVYFQRDLGFSSYSTGLGFVDWKFTHKNHFYVEPVPLFTSKQFVLNRTITFQGQTLMWARR